MLKGQPFLRARRDDPLLVFGSLLLLCILLSLSLVNQNYYLLFGIFATVLAVLLLKANLLPVAVILLIIPFADWAVEYKYLPFQVMWVPELLAGLLFIKSLARKALEKQAYASPGLPFVLVFFLLSFLSLFINGSPIIPALLMLRLLFRYYLLFLAIINLGFDEKSQKLIINILIFIFLVQLPLSVAKLFVYGQGETSLGLSSHSVSTIFPLVAIGFLYSYYLLYQRKIAYILGIFGFVGFSIVGGKRAFIFFLPVLLIYLTWILKERILRNLRLVFLGILIFFVSLYFVARLIPTLNPQREVWGEFNRRHIIDYAISYETNVSMTGAPTGRISASLEVFRALGRKGLPGRAFGYGPGSIIKSMFGGYDKRQTIRSRFGVVYGMNGLSWLGVQVGYFGTIIYFLIYYCLLRKCHSYYKKEKDPFWRSFALGMTGFSFILLFTSLIYTPFFNDDSVAAFYFCLAAIVIIRSTGFQPNNQTGIVQA